MRDGDLVECRLNGKKYDSDQIIRSYNNQKLWKIKWYIIYERHTQQCIRICEAEIEFISPICCKEQKQKEKKKRKKAILNNRQEIRR